MKHLTAVIVAALVAGVSAPASSDPAISITQPGNTKAAATTPLTYAVINSSRASVMLSTSGGCGVHQLPIKRAARLGGNCVAVDGKSTIAVTTYPAKKMLCATHIDREGGTNYTTFAGGTGACRQSQSLNHIDIVIAP
jgi:hypothetical protein